MFLAKLGKDRGVELYLRNWPKETVNFYAKPFRRECHLSGNTASFRSVHFLPASAKNHKKRRTEVRQWFTTMVGDRRIELLTSSVSRKRSTSELTAHCLTGKNSTGEAQICQHKWPLYFCCIFLLFCTVF